MPIAMKNFVVRFVHPGVSTGEPHSVQAREPVGAAILVLMDYKHYDLRKLLKELGEIMIVVNGTGSPVYFDTETVYKAVRNNFLKVRIAKT